MLPFLIQQTAAIAGFCTSGQQLCVYGQIQGTDIIFTVHGKSSGYASFGLGTQMSGSQIYVGWKNSTGGATVISCRGQGHSQPIAGTGQPIQQVSLAIPAPAGVSVAYSFKRPLQQSGFPIASGTNYIYALSSRAPSNPDVATSGYTQHTNYGSIGTYDFIANQNSNVTDKSAVDGPILQSPDSWPTGYSAYVHGILMTIAWGVLPIFGIFAAYNLKHAKGYDHLWFNLHRGAFFLSFLFSLAGFLMIFLFKVPPHLSNLHSILGALVLIVLLVQLGLGIYIDKVYDPNRTSVPFHDQAHWWIGRIVTLVAFVTVFLGIAEYNESFSGVNIALYFVFGAWLLIGGAAIAFGRRMFPQTQKHDYELTQNF
ncbi:hypothetical protein EDD86DRAFT_192865 [Gorgonomyces haynaldii]|nr:hypothetical protein EDD86DRAFT_192865 [Gorgonomyces haynaldii]